MIALPVLRTLRTLRRNPAVLLALLVHVVVVSPASAQEEAREFRLEYCEELTWSEDHPWISDWSDSKRLRWNSTPSLRREIAEEPVLCGAIILGDDTEVMLAWNAKRRLLHADLDGNGNPGDDEPIEVPALDSDPRAVPECALHLDGPRGRARIVLGEAHATEEWAVARVTSGWAGEIELDGHRWRLFVYDDLDGRLSHDASGDGMGVGTVGADKITTVPFVIPQRLGLGDGLFDLNVRFEAEGDDRVVVVGLRPAEAALVPCDLSGEHMPLGVLARNGGPGPSTVIVLHRLGGVTSLPSGDYRAVLHWDVVGGGKPLPVEADLRIDADRLLVPPQRGPVRHHLELRRKGLYWLGVQYTPRDADGSEFEGAFGPLNVPFFSVYRGPERILTRRFHYPGVYWWRVPFSVYGDLRFVVGAGPEDQLSEVNEGTVYRWPWHFHLFRFLPWLALALGLGWRENRNARAAAITIPVLLICLPWWILLRVGSDVGTFEVFCLPLALGLAAVGLLSPWIRGGNGWSRYRRAVTSAVVVAAIPLGLFYTDEREYLMLLVPVTLLATMEVLTVGAIVRYRRGARNTGWRFVGWYVGVFLGLTVVHGGLFWIVRGDFTTTSETPDAILIVLLIAAMASCTGFVLSLPFLGLAVVSRTWRLRFREVLDGKEPAS